MTGRQIMNPLELESFIVGKYRITLFFDPYHYGFFFHKWIKLGWSIAVPFFSLDITPIDAQK